MKFPTYQKFLVYKFSEWIYASTSKANENQEYWEKFFYDIRDPMIALIRREMERNQRSKKYYEKNDKRNYLSDLWK